MQRITLCTFCNGLDGSPNTGSPVVSPVNRSHGCSACAAARKTPSPAELKAKVDHILATAEAQKRRHQATLMRERWDAIEAAEKATAKRARK